MDKRKNCLIKNTAIFAIGSFSSKLLAFLLVPLYTHYLHPSDYGEVDIYLTLLAMLCIVVSLQSIESVFRFIQDCKDEKQIAMTVSNALATTLTGIFVFSVCMLIIGILIEFEYTIVFILYVSANILAGFFLQTIRGMGKTKLFAASGVVSTIISLFFNIMFIVVMRLGAKALLWTPVIMQTIIIVMILCKENLLKYCRFNALNTATIKEQIRFSFPLLPNAICIWLLSSLGRFILLFYHGTGEVGILAFVLKFPLLLETINGNFFMAWQTSAIEQYKSEDKVSFASDVFHKFSMLLLASMLVIIPFIKVAIFTMMGEAYKSAWIYIPVFLIGVIFKSYSLFFDAVFYSEKKNWSVFLSTLISGLVYFAAGIVLAKSMSIFGIGIAYSISGLVRWAVIVNRVSPYIRIKINVKQQILILMILGMFVAVYYTAGITVQVVMCLIGSTTALYLNKVLVSRLIKFIKHI